MSSEAWLACEWLDSILLRIAPRRLDRLIDEPIDAVTDDFRAALRPVTSHAELVAVIATFVQRLHAEALPVRGSVSFHEALAEGIALLNAGQRGGATGYDLAVLSVLSIGDAEEVVLQIGAVAKARERDILMKWIIEDAIARCTWDTRCRLVTGIAEIAGDDLPPEVRTSPPERWAPLLGELVLIVHQMIAQLEAAQPKSIGNEDAPGAFPLRFLLQAEDDGVGATTLAAADSERAET